ncbi:MAG: tripartite tricarboxylate transporter substrate binding protein [Betaproteobacteria bacterium]|nr:tripartite tricarboxylate transporter substrate binding protein [Betaproteobacteria bacterium]
MRTFLPRLGLAVACSVLAWGAGAADAPEYPNRSIRLIVPYPPGGVTDILARKLGEKLTARWGQAVVVDNRGGASGNIGSSIAARAPADGYTLLFGTASTHTINPALFSSIPFDPVRDFAPITLVAHVPNVLLVHPSMAAKSVAELIALAKSRPGQINYASSGSGTTTHLAGELFKIRTGVNIVHVPYKGSSAAMPDLLTGRVSMMFENIPTAVQWIKAGKLRALAVTGARRSQALPDVPTMTEAGVQEFEVTGWSGLFVPAGTPKPVIATLHGEIVSILTLADVRDFFMAHGAEPEGDTPEHFSQRLKAELGKWEQVVKVSGAKVD